MGKPLRALIVEDSELDAELLLRALRHGGFNVSFERVETAETMRSALRKQAWDIVLCDYSMPCFDGLSAFAVMCEESLDLPFIIISGTVGEAVAVAAMKAGVHDYFLKDKLGPRLIAAIEREIREAAVRADRRKMHEQLVISDRMVSMGTLAAGVAHEINNPLAWVVANLDLASRTVAECAEGLDGSAAAHLREAQEELHDAREAAHRIRDIVRDLKIFSHPEEEATSAVDVRRVMESTLRMAWNEIRHRAQLVRNYGTIAPVQASESRLGQVFLNLVVNAAQAIPDGRAGDNEIRITTSMDETGQVIIQIADTGSGMSAEILARLFTPFFTTKSIGVGTGLGLSICHRIVTGLGGSIDVKSEVGKGTVFRVSLPPAAPSPLEDEKPVAPSETAPGRRGRILVIDDEPMLARIVRRILSAEHEVMTLTSAKEALNRFADGERFDVILCDLMMPEVTGMDLHAELLRIAPDQAERMVFVTGGAFTPRARAFLDEVPNQRVEKPFDAKHLRALINDRVR